MEKLNITDDYVSEYNTIQIMNGENDENDNFHRNLLFSIPSGVLLLFLISLIIWTTLKHSFTIEKMDNILYQCHAVRRNNTGPSECGESEFLTIMVLKVIYIFEKIDICTPSKHQDLYQKKVICFYNFAPINLIPTNLKEEELDPIIDKNT